MISDLPQRLVDKIRVNPESGCWEWTGCINHGGYGIAHIGTLLSSTPGTSGPAHKVVYEALRGLVPTGKHLDHTCHDFKTCPPPCIHRRCVNPDHLEPVTPRVNLERGSSPSALNAAKTHCRRGHELSGDNLAIVQRGKRQERHCRACRIINHQNWLSDPANLEKRRRSNREYMRKYRERAK